MTEAVLAESRLQSFGKNGRYDLRLLRIAPGRLVVEVCHDLHFGFAPNERDPDIDWTDEESSGFRDTWRSQISETWDTPDHVVIEGENISVRFVSRFSASTADVHFRVQVFKLKDRTQWRGSAVCRGCYDGRFDAELDSNDDKTRRLGGQRTQTAIKHEFGHMIGLPDEYRRGSEHRNDKASVMNYGTTIRRRHLEHFVEWARPHVEGLGRHAMTKDDVRSLPDFLDRTKDAATVADAVRNWKDQLAADEVVIFSARSVETGQAIPVDEVDPEDFAGLEVVFEMLGGRRVDEVWSPPSQEALEALLEGI
jgi:hypothetical protein